MDKDGLEDYLEEAQKAGLDVNNPGIRNIIIILNDSDNAVLKENKNIKRNDLRNSEIEGLINNFGTNMMSLSSKKRYKGRRDTKYDKFLEEYKEAEPLMTVIAKFENRLHLGASKKALDSLKLKAGEISDIKDTDKDNLTEYEKKARSILEGLSKERRKELAGKKYTDDITYDDFVQKAFLNGWELEKDLPFLELVFEKFTKLSKKTDGDEYNGVTSTVVSIFNSKAKTYRFKARVAVHAGKTTGMHDTFDDFANYYRREAVNDYLTRNDESVYKEAARAGWKEESDKEFIDALKIQYNKDIRNRKGESAIPDPNQKKQMGIPQKYDNDMQKLVKFFFGVFKTPKEKLDYLKAINRAKNNLVTEHRALAIYDKTVARYEEIVNPGLNSGNVIHDGQEDINAQKEADKKHIEEENRRREEEKARKEKEEAERRKAEEDAKKAEEERVRREEEEKKRLEEENKRREEERVRKEREEADKRKAEEERKRIEEENKRREEEEKRKAEEERKRREEEEKRKAEEDRKRREEEEKRKAEEDKKRREEEEKRKAEEDRKRREEEEKRKAEEERKRVEEENKRKAENAKPVVTDRKSFEQSLNDLLDRFGKVKIVDTAQDKEKLETLTAKAKAAGLDVKNPGIKNLLTLAVNANDYYDQRYEGSLDGHVLETFEEAGDKKITAPAGLLHLLMENISIDLKGSAFSEADKSNALLKPYFEEIIKLKDFEKNLADEKKEEKEQGDGKADGEPEKKPSQKRKNLGMAEADYEDDEEIVNNINPGIRKNNINDEDEKEKGAVKEQGADEKLAREYAKRYDQLEAVKNRMVHQLESFKAAIMKKGQKDKKLYQKGLDAMSQNEKDSAFLKDGSVFYRRMATALNDCIRFLNDPNCYGNMLAYKLFELENRAIQYQEYNKPVFGRGSKDKVEGPGHVRYLAAENLEKFAGIWRMEYNYLYRQLMTMKGGKDYSGIASQKRLADKYKADYGIEENYSPSKEELDKYSAVSGIRSQFANKLAHVNKATVKFYDAYSVGKNIDDFLQHPDCPQSLEGKALWFVCKQEYDKLFSNDISPKKAKKLLDSFSGEKFKKRVADLRKNPVFIDVVAKYGNKAFSKWMDVEKNTLETAVQIFNTKENSKKLVLGSFPLTDDNLDDAYRKTSDYIVRNIVSKPEYLNILRAAFAWNKDEDMEPGDATKRRLSALAISVERYLRRNNLLRPGRITKDNVAERILNNPKVLKSIVNSYLRHNPVTAPDAMLIRDKVNKEDVPGYNMINNINLNTEAKKDDPISLTESKSKNTIISEQ